MLGLMTSQDVQILKDRICGPPVPGLLSPLLCRQQLDKLLEPSIQKSPTMLDMTDQALCLVLGRDTDTTDAGVHTVREWEIDDAKLTTERDRRLRTPVRELVQPATPTTGQYQ